MLSTVFGAGDFDVDAPDGHPDGAGPGRGPDVVERRDGGCFGQAVAFVDFHSEDIAGICP